MNITKPTISSQNGVDKKQVTASEIQHCNPPSSIKSVSTALNEIKTLTQPTT
jgi:hypothetical protein